MRTAKKEASHQEKGFAPHHSHKRVSGTTFQIVKPGVYHLDEICAIEQASYPLPWSKESFHAEFFNPNSFALGLICEGQIIAYAFHHLIRDELHILNVAVHPDFRSRHLGKILFCHVLIEAVQIGARFATLEVRQSNFIAQRLYRSFGFRFVRVRRGYYQNNGEDAFVLERKLSDGDLASLQQLFSQA